MVDALTQRRFDGNTDNWSLKMPSPKRSPNRTVSTRSLRGINIDSLQNPSQSYQSHNLTSLSEAIELSPSPQPHTPSKDTPISGKNTTDFSSIPNTKTNCERFKQIYQQMKIKMKNTITDQWRRATQSGNDPYVKITLKPTPRNGSEMSFQTKPILGGGMCVGFDPVHDNAEWTFLCQKNINALNHKYLKIEVFDVETGTTDRMIGTAHIILKHFAKHVNKTVYYTAVPLYGSQDTNYQWSGTVEIHVTFQKIGMKQVDIINERIMAENSKKFRFSNDKPIMRMPTVSRARSATDQIMLARVKSTADEETQKRLQIEALERLKEKEELEKKEKEQTNARIIQGFIVNLTLFISLVLSGALFLGAMNIHEVDGQTIFFRDTFNTKFSVIDTFRFSIVTVTTIGYGDCYPQTTGGRMFGTFMIIFGVSLLARLLNSVLDRASANYEEQRLKAILNRRACTHDSMHEFDIDGDGVITSYEFLRTMLLRREDTTLEVIEDIMKLFDSYDEDKSGEIETAEIKELIKKKQQNKMSDDEVKEIEMNEQKQEEIIDINMDENDENDSDNMEVELAALDNINKIDDGNDMKSEENGYNYYHNVVDDYYYRTTKRLRRKRKKKKLNNDGYINKQTFSDSMLMFMKQKNIQNIKRFLEYISDEEYDSDAIAQDMWDIYDENNIIVNESNILSEVCNDELIANYVIEELESFEYALNIHVVGCDDLPESDQHEAAEDSFWLFIKGWFGFVAYLLIGAMIFSFVENANFGDMLWFAVVTTCTVGYGDVRPVTTIGRILNAFFIAVSVVLFVSVFSTTFDYIYARQEALVKQKATNKKTISNMVKKFPILEAALKKIEYDEEQKENKRILTERKEKHEIINVPSKVNDVNVQQKSLENIDENQETSPLQLSHKTVSELHPDDVTNAFENNDEENPYNIL